jgi:hypothetical protein
MYRRSAALLEHLEPHIFHGGRTRAADVRAAGRSLWRQGILGRARREYFRLLWKGISRDLTRSRGARRAAIEMQQRVKLLPTDEHCSAAASDSAGLSMLVDRAREALVRAERARPLAEVDAWAASLKQKIEVRSTAPADLRTLYRWSREYFVRQRQLHRFPGAYLVKAFNLAIKGLHYDIVMTGIVRQSNTGTRDSDDGCSPQDRRRFFRGRR